MCQYGRSVDPRYKKTDGIESPFNLPFLEAHDMKDKTVAQAVQLVHSTGGVSINPLTTRKNPYKSACFSAAKLGLVKKVRVNCGLFIFYPLDNSHAPQANHTAPVQAPNQKPQVPPEHQPST